MTRHDASQILPVNHISDKIIAAAMKIHSTLGPGLLESVYEARLLHELRKQGLKVERQVLLAVIYDGVTIDLNYRMDLVVEDLVVIESKCVQALDRVHERQILSYPELSGKTVGLLINFHVAHLRNGIKRFVNGQNWQN